MAENSSARAQHVPALGKIAVHWLISSQKYMRNRRLKATGICRTTTVFRTEQEPPNSSSKRPTTCKLPLNAESCAEANEHRHPDLPAGNIVTGYWPRL